MTPKHRERLAIVLLALVLLAVVSGLVAYGSLTPKQPKDEPQYQGRYLSEWFEEYEAARSEVDLLRRAEAEAAVRSIGTNALPYFLKWMTNEPHGGDIDIDIERRRACVGFDILGSNAVSAVPGLLAIMITPPKREYYGFTLGVLDPYTAASYALQSIGESALPAFKAGLADPNPTNRCRIVSAFNNSMRFNWTNLYAPTLAAALNDPDPEVRHAANYVLNCDFGNTSIPDLAAMIKRANSSDHTRVVAAALSYIGPPAVPAVKGLLADPNQRDRDQILYAAFYAMPNYISSPLVIESLQHQDLQVRNAATNIISENSRYWPGLTNGLRK